MDIMHIINSNPKAKALIPERLKDVPTSNAGLCALRDNIWRECMAFPDIPDGAIFERWDHTDHFARPAYGLRLRYRFPDGRMNTYQLGCISQLWDIANLERDMRRVEEGTHTWSDRQQRFAVKIGEDPRSERAIRKAQLKVLGEEVAEEYLKALVGKRSWPK